ncbi:hypothetical protein M1K096_1493 [Staphylococcus aureus]|nr:hypothetical protein M1K096_1493 [Staphylococcus aureus]GBX98524.1 hypothetical protein M6K018_1363 [Staphylococcus aureus]GBZ22875.1 hypothetical protein M6K123_0329 [Staphylococcus aureus]
MKILAIVRRVLKEMLRDKRTLALMFLAPILILTLMYFIFNGDENDLKNRYRYICFIKYNKTIAIVRHKNSNVPFS